MKVLPTEIRSKSFRKRTFGGLNPQEVRDFLMQLSDEFQFMHSRNSELEGRLETTQQELERLRQMERALLDAFKQAEDQKREIIEQAKKEAQTIVLKGEMMADNVVNQAKQQAYSMLQRVKNECDMKMKHLSQEFTILDSNCQTVEKHVEGMISEMQRFVDDTNTTIAHLATLKDRQAIAEKLRLSKELLSKQSETRQEVNDWVKQQELAHVPAPKAPRAEARPETPKAEVPKQVASQQPPAAEAETKTGTTLLERLQQQKNGHGR